MFPPDVFAARYSCMEGSCCMSSRKVSPAMKVLWLSDRIKDSIPFEAASRLKHMMNDAVVRLSTTSRCTALVVTHTKRQMYALAFLPCAFHIVKLPVWSTPTFVNGGTQRTHSVGRGGGSGLGKVRFLVLWQMTHLRRRLLMCERILGVQQRCLYKDDV